jgi:hypothetical protein
MLNEKLNWTDLTEDIAGEVPEDMTWRYNRLEDNEEALLVRLLFSLKRLLLSVRGKYTILI